MTATGQPKTSQGPIDRAPCPHCGKPQDFRELKQQQLLDTGNQMVCEHCGLLQTVLSIRVVEVLVLRPDPGRPRATLPDAQPATTVSQGLLGRILGPGKPRR